MISLALTVAGMVAGCMLGPGMPCEDSIDNEEASPDGLLIATVYRRDCGATTPINRQVGLRRFEEEFDGSRGSVFVVKGEPAIELAWLDPRTLKVSCADYQAVSLLRREEVWEGVSIECELTE